jgi:hypothetical protein
MRIRRTARRCGGIEMITLVIELLLPTMAPVRREAPASMESDTPMGR